MPQIKSAKKRVKVAAKKEANNKAANTALKTAIKKAYAAIDDNAQDKEAVVKAAVKKIDKAAAKNLLHKNTEMCIRDSVWIIRNRIRFCRLVK